MLKICIDSEFRVFVIRKHILDIDLNPTYVPQKKMLFSIDFEFHAFSPLKSCCPPPYFYTFSKLQDNQMCTSNSLKLHVMCPRSRTTCYSKGNPHAFFGLLRRLAKFMPSCELPFPLPTSSLCLPLLLLHSDELLHDDMHDCMQDDLPCTSASTHPSFSGCLPTHVFALDFASFVHNCLLTFFVCRFSSLRRFPCIRYLSGTLQPLRLTPQQTSGPMACNRR